MAPLGGLHPAPRRRAAPARRQRPRAGRGDGASERARHLCPPRRGGEHLGRSQLGDHRLEPGGRRAVLRPRQRQAVPASSVLQGAESGEGIVSSLAEYLLGLGDDRLILGHRLSEWCGHGPILEEDIAITNIALDLIGQATLFLKLAAAAEARGRSEDDFAFLRDATEFRNVLLVELPRGDFAFTVVRQLLFSVYSLLLTDALSTVAHADLAGVAAKAAKETRYHVRHAAQWVVTLGDGTPESHARAQSALDELWRYSGELFIPVAADLEATAAGVGVNPESLAEPW